MLKLTLFFMFYEFFNMVYMQWKLKKINTYQTIDKYIKRLQKLEKTDKMALFNSDYMIKDVRSILFDNAGKLNVIRIKNSLITSMFTKQEIARIFIEFLIDFFYIIFIGMLIFNSKTYIFGIIALILMIIFNMFLTKIENYLLRYFCFLLDSFLCILNFILMILICGLL